MSGQDCADAANYNDRILEPVLEPTTINTCFGECSTDGSCAPPPTVFYDVTFNVNMANETVAESGVYLAGGGNFGNPGDNEMTDPDGDGIYSITMMLDEGFSSFYTFTNGACGDWSCKEENDGVVVVVDDDDDTAAAAGADGNVGSDDVCDCEAAEECGCCS